MTIKEIAKRAGVSVSTVSKVMNHKDSSISQETRDRVLQIAKEYNYTPYAGVISGNAKSFLIGVMFSSPETEFIISGILNKIREQGYMAIIAKIGEEDDSELKAAAAFYRHSVDAVIWEPKDMTNLSCLEYFHSVNIPCILISSSQRSGSYGINFEELSRCAVTSLLQAGHQDIACLTHSSAYCSSFIDGYRKAFFDFGIPLQEQLIFT